MRKKIEELRNREEGFTLVELLAVIVILGIIVAIAIPVIGNVTDRAQSGANTAQEELVIDAAQLYMIENQSDLSFSGAPASDTISVQEDLIGNGYLENDDRLTGDVTVTRNPVSNEDGEERYQYTYSYDLD